MARKPYIHKQPDGWYKKNSFYIWYMLREATSLTTAITALNLFYGIACLAGIAGALLNSKTWFEAMPKAIRIQRGEKFLPDNVLIRGAWGAWGGVLVILLIIVAWLA